MKRILPILLLTLASAVSAQTTGQNSIEKKASTGSTKESFTLSPSQIIGRTAAGTLGGITLGSGLTLTGSTLSASGAAWADITGKPTTLNGYGITDAITTAAAASTYAPIASPTFTGTISGASLSLSGGISVTGNVSTGAGNFETTVGNISTGSGIISGNGSSITAINASNISSGTLNSSRLATSGVTAGSYTNSSITVDTAGRVTSASSGAAAANTIYTLPTTITWTGGGCYALNKMVTSYTGAAITLIRASDSDTEDFGFLADGRFNLPAYLTWVSGTTAKVTVWYDQSGNGFNATQTTEANRPEFRINVQGQPVVYFRDADFTPQLFLTLPVGITNNLINLTQITVARCVDELQAYVSAPVWPSFGIGTAFSAFGANDGVVEITSASTTQGFYDRSLNGQPIVYLSLYPTTSRLEAVGIYNTGTGGNSSDQRYITTSYRSPRTITGAIQIWKNAGVAQMPVGGRLGCRGDLGAQSQAEAVCMLVARGGSISQTEEMMMSIKQSFGLRPRPKRILWWCGDSLAASYEGGYDYKGRSPGVLCDAMQDDYIVFTFAKAGKRWDQLDSDAASSTNGIDPWLSAAETKMAKAADIFVLLGANDLNATANGGSAVNLATLQSRCNTFIGARKASGAGRVFVGTIPAAGAYITTDATRTDFNAWLLAGSSSADGVVDLAALNWVGKMQGDGVHWTQDGNAMAARAVADFLMGQN